METKEVLTIWGYDRTSNGGSCNPLMTREIGGEIVDASNDYDSDVDFWMCPALDGKENLFRPIFSKDFNYNPLEEVEYGESEGDALSDFVYANFPSEILDRADRIEWDDEVFEIRLYELVNIVERPEWVKKIRGLDVDCSGLTYK